MIQNCKPLSLTNLNFKKANFFRISGSFEKWKGKEVSKRKEVAGLKALNTHVFKEPKSPKGLATCTQPKSPMAVATSCHCWKAKLGPATSEKGAYHAWPNH